MADATHVAGTKRAADKSAVTMPPLPRWATSEPLASMRYSIGPRLLAMIRGRRSRSCPVRASRERSLSGEELDRLEMDITAVVGNGRLLSIAERAQAVNLSCLDRRRSSPLS